MSSVKKIDSLIKICYKIYIINIFGGIYVKYYRKNQKAKQLKIMYSDSLFTILSTLTCCQVRSLKHLNSAHL